MSDLIHVNPYEVMFILRRDRDPKEFEMVKDSIRQLGQRTILKVQDISDWKPEERRRPDGAPSRSSIPFYKWRAAFGQGRCEAAIQLYEETKDRAYLKVPAREIKSAESELVGMSMTENFLRRDYTWLEKAHLMKRDVENLPLPVVAKGWSVTVSHLKKVLKILQRLNPAVEKELKSLTVEQAEAFTMLKPQGQAVVIDVLKEEGLREAHLPALVRKARELTDGSTELSKSALKASLRRVNEDLQRARESVKPLRLHYAIGSENIQELLSDKKHKHIRAAILAAGIKIDRFEELIGQ